MANGGKTLNCKKCDEPVNNVGFEATAVTCWRCVSKMVSACPPECSELD